MKCSMNHKKSRHVLNYNVWIFSIVQFEWGKSFHSHCIVRFQYFFMFCQPKCNFIHCWLGRILLRINYFFFFEGLNKINWIPGKDVGARSYSAGQRRRITSTSIPTRSWASIGTGATNAKFESSHGCNAKSVKVESYVVNVDILYLNLKKWRIEFEWLWGYTMTSTVLLEERIQR